MMASCFRFSLTVSFLFLTIIAGASKAHQRNGFTQSNNQLIMMTVTVWNRSGFVKGLNREAFGILDERVPRTIDFFESADDPVSIGIVIDTSGSMDLPDLRQTARPKPIGEVIANFLELGNPKNEYFLLSFNKTQKLLADWSSAQNLLSRKTDIEEGKGNTALYDACFVAAEKLTTSRFPRRVVMLFSDGQDNLSRHSFQDLRNLLRDSDITLYAIGIMWPSDIGSSLGLEGQGVLDELSEITGGKAFIVKDKKQMTIAVAEIATELHNQYRIGFRADQNDMPNKWRRLKLTVTPPISASQEFRKLSFRIRRGYYSH